MTIDYETLSPAELDWLNDAPKGWHEIILPLIRAAQACGAHIDQIKEKFGGLCFYISGGTNDIYDKIDTAEKLSYKTCQDCGKPGHLRHGAWLRTLCDEHAKLRGYDSPRSINLIT